jgi:hypothetical protein
MAARVKIDKYANALKTCQNMIPIVQGGVTRRPRTTFVAEVKDSANYTRQIPFEFSVEQAYQLEFGNLYIRFYMDNGQIQVSGVSAWVTATAYVAGNIVSNGGTNYYCKTAHTSGATFAGDAAYWYAITGTIFEIPTTYTTAQLADLNFTQSVDVLYLCHPDHPPRKLSRTGHTSWTLTDVAFIDGPFLNTNITTTTIAPSATSGNITLTASASLWVSTDVGRHVRIKHGSTWGYAFVTAYTSATVVNATVVENFGAATAQSNWRLGVFSETTGYPSCSMFFEDRIFYAGCNDYPQRIDGSRTGTYDDFSPSDSDGTVTASHSLAVSLNSSNVNNIQWMMDDEKGLLVGTVGGEWIVRPSTLSEAMSSTNVTAKRSTGFGSSKYQAIRTGRASLYIQRAGRKVRELAYVYEVDGFRSPDMTIMSEHISEGGLTHFDYQQEPWGVVWFVRADGVLVGLTYERDHEVIGWHRHIIGGSFGSGNAVVESLSVIPNAAGTADELWLIVKRTIDGSTKRYIEYMEGRFDGEDTINAMFGDSGLSYDGSPVSVISGLDHLEGETVQVLADGATHPDRVVASGAITLNRSASVVHVGLGYQSDIATLNIEAGAQDGTAQGKIKRIHSVSIRLYKTLGLQFGPNADGLDTMTFRTTADAMNNPPALFTGDKRVEWNGSYETEGSMYFRQEQPLPLTILGLFPQLRTEDRG